VPSTAPIAPASSSSVKWVDNNGVKYPFPAHEADYDGDDVFNPIQFNATGIVSAAFLNVGALSHTLKFTIAQDDVQRIKTLIESSPDYRATDQFKWPFVDGVATANNKDNLASAFENVYDGRNKAAGDLGEEDMLPAHRIRPSVKVEVEYTPTCWVPKKSKDSSFINSGSNGRLNSFSSNGLMIETRSSLVARESWTYADVDGVKPDPNPLGLCRSLIIESKVFA
jgi:hypothetical protein